MRKIVFVGMALAIAASAAGAINPGRSGSVLSTTTGGGEIMTNDKIITLVKAGLSDTIVKRMIKGASRTLFDLTSKGVLSLAKGGVSEGIINVMMDIWEKQRKHHDRNIRIFIQMMRTDRKDEYDRAVRELVAYGAYGVPLLVENLRDEDERIRAGACEVLGQIRDPASLDALFQVILDRNKAVRARAARAVSSFDKEVVAPRLVAGLGRRGFPRDGHALALGYLGDLSHLGDLLRLADDPGPEVDRAAAAFALGLLGDPRPDVLKVLKDSVLTDPFRDLREAAARALGRLSQRMGEAARSDAARALVVSMKRFAASRDVLALQLRYFPTRRAAEALIEFLGDREKSVASASWEALKAITGEEYPQDVDQWRSWWEIARIQPRWRPGPVVGGRLKRGGGFEPLPLPEIPGFEPTEDEPPDSPETAEDEQQD